jgi:hypothetical protein
MQERLEVVQAVSYLAASGRQEAETVDSKQ